MIKKVTVQVIELLNDQKVDERDLEQLREQLLELSRALINMVFRENNILYPTLNVLLSEGEWHAIKEGEELIGYFKVKPNNEWQPKADPIYPYQLKSEIGQGHIKQLSRGVRGFLKGSSEKDLYELIRPNDLELGSGYLSLEEIDAILRTLPVDISFVDKDDKLRYYSEKEERVFVRTKTVLGRPVELCHPPRSVHIVKRIINEFKAGKRNIAEFWINMGGKLIYIKYLPVRDRNGNYLGTLEVVQDITEIKRIEGEKRLLD